MSAILKTPHGDIPIVASETITPERARKVAFDLSTASGQQQYTIQDYSHANPDEQLVYSGPERIIQIMPGFQNAAHLRNAQDANPNGRGWEFKDNNPERAGWNPFPLPTPDTGPITGGPEGEQINIMGLAAGPAVAYNAEVLRLLNAILNK